MRKIKSYQTNLIFIITWRVSWIEIVFSSLKKRHISLEEHQEILCRLKKKVRLTACNDSSNKKQNENGDFNTEGHQELLCWHKQESDTNFL